MKKKILSANLLVACLLSAASPLNAMLRANVTIQDFSRGTQVIIKDFPKDMIPALQEAADKGNLTVHKNNPPLVCSTAFCLTFGGLAGVSAAHVLLREKSSHSDLVHDSMAFGGLSLATVLFFILADESSR